MHDVLIIGAGAAGIEAARVLAQAEKDFLILEARDGIGGRVRSRKNQPDIELGAEFIHGPAPITKQYLREARLGWKSLFDPFHFYDRRRIHAVPGYWNRLANAFSHLRHRRRDRSFNDFIYDEYLTPSERALAASFIEGFDAADLTRAGANALVGLSKFFRDPTEHAIGRPVSGYRPLLEALARPFSMQTLLNTRVTSIEWKRGLVAAHTELNGQPRTYRARTAIITVPIGVLKAHPDQPGAIRFSPEVPGLAKNLALLEMGQVVRVSLRFAPEARNLWKRKFPRGFPFIASPGLDFMTWWGNDFRRGPLITAWAGGSHAIRMNEASLTDRSEHAVKNLAQILGFPRSKLERVLLGTETHDWGHDPFSRGAYSYVGIGGENAPKQLRRPVADTLYFAGEALEDEESGTVEAAFRSGRHQAKKLLARLTTKGRAPRGDRKNPKEEALRKPYSSSSSDAETRA